MPRGLPGTWAGSLPFTTAVERNLADAAACRAGDRGRVLLFEPTEALFTLGRRANTPAGRRQLATTLSACARRGIAVQAADRGGLGSLHLPGQLVCFLARPCRRSELPRLVTALLQAAADLARSRSLDIRIDTSDDAGLWCGNRKLASVGLRLDRGVVCHGMALNVAVDPRLAVGLTLCGHPDGRLANLHDRSDSPLIDVASADISLAEVAAELAEALGLQRARLG